MSVLDEVQRVLHDLQGFLDWIGTGGYVAGLPDDVRKAAEHWRQAGDALDALVGRLDCSLGQDVHLGAGGNWNDESSQSFQSYWTDVRAALQEQAAHAHDMAGTLNHAAGEMDNFNSALEAIEIEIGIWIAATLILMWVPVIDMGEAAVAVVRGATLLDKAWGVVRLILGLLRAIALVFGRAPRAARALRLLEKAAKLREGAEAARLARGGSLIAKVRDWRALRLAAKGDALRDVATERKAEAAIQVYRASWVGRLRIGANLAKSDRLFRRASAAVDAGRPLRAARLMERGLQAQRDAQVLPAASTFYKLWTGYRINSLAWFPLRAADHWGGPQHNLDPTKGWQSYEWKQIMGGTALFTAMGFGLGPVVGRLSGAPAGWLTRGLGLAGRSATTRFWVGGALDRLPGVTAAGLSAFSAPAQQYVWATMNLSALGAGGAKLRQGTALAFTSNLAVTGPVGFPLNSAVAIALPGAGWAEYLPVPVMWTLGTYQEVTDDSVRAARGIPNGGALNNLLRPSDFTVPQPGPFPAAALPSHVVAPGDSLWDIARRQYGSGLYYPDIARWNHLSNPDLIRPGQQLTLPPVRV
jgi:LysM repeat protein